MINPALVSAFRFHMQQIALRTDMIDCPIRAIVAVRAAREDVAAGKVRYPGDGNRAS